MTLKPRSQKLFLALANESIAARLEKRNPVSLDIPREENAPRGVFVTIFSNSGDLRGCIGHIWPVRKTLAEEVSECAQAAAFEDPRFPPLSKDEFNSIRLEISLLSPLHTVTDVSTLNEKRYGVVVSNGMRKGVLLPNISGVESVAMQIDIARQKAGIGKNEPIQLQRFEVEKITP